MKKKYLFVSGPHGCGKTTLINKLVQTGLFEDNEFDLNFIKEFKSLKVLSNFERCLLRLYHRHYIANYISNQTSKHNKIILVSRSIYDSEAYIEVNKEINWITESEYTTLRQVYDNMNLDINVIIVNPDPELIFQRLNKRINEGVRKERDKIFRQEDTLEFIKKLHNQFKKYKDYENTLYIEDTNDKEVEYIIKYGELNG